MGKQVLDATRETPGSAIDALGSELNSVLPRMLPLWVDAESRFPGEKLIGVIIRDQTDPGDNKSMAIVLRFDDFVARMAPTLFNGLDARSRVLLQIYEDPGPDALWLAITNGKNIYTTRMRRVVNAERVIYSPGFSNEELPDRELLRLSLATWNAMQNIRDRGRRDGDALALMVAKGETPLPPAMGLQFCEAWAEHGYPRMVTSHKFAAALMCTKARTEDVEDIHIPWDAFQVVIPNGLLVRPDTGEEYDHMIVTIKDGLAQAALYTGHGKAAWLTVAMPVGSLLSADADIENEERVDEGTVRVLFMARRLLAGLLLTLDEASLLRDRKRTAGTFPPSGRDAPKHRVFSIGKAINVDCRQAVKAFLGGSRKGAPPSVQTLVRGHYKRQVVGVTRMGRKVIWIEPYWRGPEDAPILARPYKIGPADASPSAAQPSGAADHGMGAEGRRTERRA